MKAKNLIIIALVSLVSAVSAVFLFNKFGKQKVVNQFIPVGGAQQAAFKENSFKGGFDFKKAAQKGLPAVVHIRSTVDTKNSTQQRRSANPMEDLMEQFFNTPRGQDVKRRPSIGFGSGVIISPDGYIVTNNHVIDNATEIKVTFYDSKIVEAELVGTDPTTDVALLKVKESNLPYLQFANSDQAQVGEWVAAIGNPAVGGDAYALKSTVTAGIISAIGRNVGIIRQEQDLAIESFIQTDAVINRGNSGGALVDINGDLIGINTAISTPTGVYAGYGFAVPANLVKKVITDLKEFGEVKRALLGVQYQDIENVKSMGGEIDTKEKEGLLINNVSAGSAAEKAGLQPDDVIIKVDGKAVTDGQQNKLQEIIGRKRPGDVVKVTYKRNGKQYSTDVTLLSAEETTKNYKVAKNETLFEDLGLSLENLSKKQKEDFEIEGGVRVNQIDRRGLLYRGSYGDITTGFIITTINGIAVKNVDDASKALKKTRNGYIQIQGFNEQNPSQSYKYTFPAAR